MPTNRKMYYLKRFLALIIIGGKRLIFTVIQLALLREKIVRVQEDVFHPVRRFVYIDDILQKQSYNLISQ